MVMPVIMSYCSLIISLGLPRQEEANLKVLTLERRVRSIIFQDENPSKLKVKISAIGDCQMIKICTLTYRCMKTISILLIY
jgi:hypothetical protein